MNKIKRNILLATCFLLVTFSFWLMCQFSISVGDDLGYMFTDTALHKADGKLIESIFECFSTQANHYFSTNGRFLVHTATHFFTAIADLDLYRITNTMMFGILWLLIAIFIKPKHTNWNYFICLIALFMLWVFTPDAGTTMLSLVAFATNYMWSAVAYLGFIILLKTTEEKEYKFKSYYHLYIAYSIISLIVGSLHESYSIPIGVSIFVMSAFRFKQIKSLSLVMMLSFFIG